MKNLIISVVIVAVSFSFYILGFYAGKRDKQTEIENRAKELNKECYTNQDIEYIIFKESQL
jgi:uncharacterized membrane protein